jgi:methyltransferase (TIGR00027 family)
MAEIQAGLTALITAYARAYHATHDSPKIFDDFLADQYYTPQEHTSFDQSIADHLDLIDPELASTHPDQATALDCIMQTMYEPITLSRSRFCEDSLEDAVCEPKTESKHEPLGERARQYVILGAGFDTFAFRRPDLVSQLQVFELDHPVTQAMKRERIIYAGWPIPPQLTFVPVDFNQETLTSALARTTYDPALMSFFSWLGVTYYLSKEVVFTTLRTMRNISPPGSTIVFDYMDADSFISDKVAPRTALMHAVAQQVGEPMKSGFNPQTLAGELSSVGLELIENLGPAEIEQRYFQGRTDSLHAFEHVQFARAVCV